MTRPDPNAEAQAAALASRPGRFSLAGLFQPAMPQAGQAEPVWQITRAERAQSQGQAKDLKARPALPVLLAA